ncbi:MAG: hypothetical protein K0R61_5702, partial [Microvirga sp.]|nr:hypothetical protein [Microvirga sp.]
LGAVQNMSRDWVIDKMTVGVTYDSDIDKAKKLIPARSSRPTQSSAIRSSSH